MRGKVVYAGLYGGDAGITPAGAGKSPRDIVIESGGGDHPRRCGEKLKLRQSKTIKRGSPPQVRGKAGAARTPVTKLWITPAGAGKRY